MIAIQVSLYPIGEKNIDIPLNAFWDILKKEKINYKITPLSTITWDNNEDKLYKAIYKAYKEARKICHAVMITTLTTGEDKDIDKLLQFLN
jgi:uncharacterized protein YqgV (UPF0045/DUF77 family)